MVGMKVIKLLAGEKADTDVVHSYVLRTPSQCRWQVFAWDKRKTKRSLIVYSLGNSPDDGSWPSHFTFFYLVSMSLIIQDLLEGACCIRIPSH